MVRLHRLLGDADSFAVEVNCVSHMSRPETWLRTNIIVDSKLLLLASGVQASKQVQGRNIGIRIHTRQATTARHPPRRVQSEARGELTIIVHKFQMSVIRR